MKSKVTQKAVIRYLQEIYPNKATFDEIATNMGITGIALVDLEYALYRLYKTGRAVRVNCPDQFSRYGFSH